MFKRQTKLESADSSKSSYQKGNSIRLKRNGTTKAEVVGGKKHTRANPLCLAQRVFMHGVCVCVCVCVVCVSNACECVCVHSMAKKTKHELHIIMTTQ